MQRGEIEAPAAAQARSTAIGADGEPVDGRGGDATAPTRSSPRRFPCIVIVVDEFADLMMQQGKDVETVRRASRAEGARRGHARHPRDAAARASTSSPA